MTVVNNYCVLTALACACACGCGSTAEDSDTDVIHPGIYVVESDDGLWSIANRAYGDGELWFGLLNANKHVSKRVGFALEEGESLVIPERLSLDTSLPKSVFPEVLPATYVIMPGDSLHFIAKGCYGDRDEWIRIYEANRSTLSASVKNDTRLLTAGDEIYIPAKP